MLDILARSMFLATGRDGFTETAEDRKREFQAEEARRRAERLRHRPLFWL